MRSACRRGIWWCAYLCALLAWHQLLSQALPPPVQPPSALPSPLPPSPPPPPPPSLAISPVAAAAKLSPPPPIAAGDFCGARSSDGARTAQYLGPKEHRDLDGAVMVPGAGPGALSLSPHACCEECAKTRGCNVYVACSNEQNCGRQCWLKWAEDPAKPAMRGEGSGVAWTSGTLPKDVPAMTPTPPAQVLNRTRVVGLTTAFGEMRIRLRPEWHVPSVRYVQHVAQADVCTVKCQLYRAEPGFLLQGAMRAVIAPNKETQERARGTPMERGHVAWAGGSAGPDFFITMTRVAGFGGSHTVWGELADEESMQLALKLVKRKISPSVKPGEMRILDEPITFTVSDNPRGKDANAGVQAL